MGKRDFVASRVVRLAHKKKKGGGAIVVQMTTASSRSTLLIPRSLRWLNRASFDQAFRIRDMQNKNEKERQKINPGSDCGSDDDCLVEIDTADPALVEMAEQGEF
eukprot:CAMPEP_0171653658 /NCGR_PEP_ID=MMETSP0990-20121206/39684_1 /TAXON_ID=483369 /ORGANISM="non described non described, Strain CCMP2098" /LENGTH=104 /DNA_ID=CAMNT_0012233117 /DNA_START=356 /DNA_END=670 /DNA_ORIENTATION=-